MSLAYITSPCAHVRSRLSSHFSQPVSHGVCQSLYRPWSVGVYQ